MGEQVNKVEKDLNEYNLPSRKERHRRKSRSKKNINFDVNQMKLSQYILKTLLFYS